MPSKGSFEGLRAATFEFIEKAITEVAPEKQDKLTELWVPVKEAKAKACRENQQLRYMEKKLKAILNEQGTPGAECKHDVTLISHPGAETQAEKPKELRDTEDKLRSMIARNMELKQELDAKEMTRVQAIKELHVTKARLTSTGFYNERLIEKLEQAEEALLEQREINDNLDKIIVNLESMNHSSERMNGNMESMRDADQKLLSIRDEQFRLMESAMRDLIAMNRQTIQETYEEIQALLATEEEDITEITNLRRELAEEREKNLAAKENFEIIKLKHGTMSQYQRHIEHEARFKEQTERLRKQEQINQKLKDKVALADRLMREVSKENDEYQKQHEKDQDQIREVERLNRDLEKERIKLQDEAENAEILRNVLNHAQTRVGELTDANSRLMGQQTSEAATNVPRHDQRGLENDDEWELID